VLKGCCSWLPWENVEFPEQALAIHFGKHFAYKVAPVFTTAQLSTFHVALVTLLTKMGKGV